MPSAPEVETRDRAVSRSLLRQLRSPERSATSTGPRQGLPRYSNSSPAVIRTRPPQETPSDPDTTLQVRHSHPSELTEADIVAWATHANPANNTVYSRVSRARTFLRWCERNRYVDNNVTDHLADLDSPLRTYQTNVRQSTGEEPRTMADTRTSVRTAANRLPRRDRRRPARRGRDLPRSHGYASRRDRGPRDRQPATAAHHHVDGQGT